MPNMHGLARTCLAGLALLLPVAPAICQDKYTQPALEHKPSWAAVIYTVVALIAICVVAFKHARRTHLD
jgi:hypothetical protein